MRPRRGKGLDDPNRSPRDQPENLKTEEYDPKTSPVVGTFRGGARDAIGIPRVARGAAGTASRPLVSPELNLFRRRSLVFFGSGYVRKAPPAGLFQPDDARQRPVAAGARVTR